VLRGADGLIREYMAKLYIDLLCIQRDHAHRATVRAGGFAPAWLYRCACRQL